MHAPRLISLLSITATLSTQIPECQGISLQHYKRLLLEAEVKKFQRAHKNALSTCLDPARLYQ